MLRLINRKDVMGDYTNSWLYNIFVWAIVAFLIVMTLASTVGALLSFI